MTAEPERRSPGADSVRRPGAWRWAWLLPLVAGLVAYIQAPLGQMVWDDRIVIEQQMSAIGTVHDAWSPPADIPEWSYTYFRPAVTLSYMADRKLFGLGGIAGWHAANVAWHLLATFFVWLLLRRLLRHCPGGEGAALAAALLFAVHPIHTESVDWITGRSDVLATAFLIPSVLLALRWRDHRSIAALLAAPVLYLLAVLSKEVAIAGLVIVPAVLLLAPAWATAQAPASSGRSRPVALAIAWLPIAVLYGAATWQYFVFRQAAGIGQPLQAHPADIPLPWELARAGAYYLIKVVAPWPQSNFVVWEMLPGVVATLLVVALAAALLAWAVMRAWTRIAGRLLLGLVWFIAALLPSLAALVFVLAPTPVAERYLYLPSVGAAIAVGALLAPALASRWGRPAAIGAAALVIAYAALTVERGHVWLSDLRLWADTATKVPGHGFPLNALANAYDNAGDEDKALATLLRARALGNDAKGRANIDTNIAALYRRHQDLPEAMRYGQAAVDAMPGNAALRVALGRLHFDLGIRMTRKLPPDPAAAEEFRLAISTYQGALRLDGGLTDARIELARAYVGLGDALRAPGQRVDAETAYRSAISELQSLVRGKPSLIASPDLRAIRSRALDGLSAP